MSYKKNAVPWERISEKYYGELQAKVGLYTDDQFKDYFFGGDTFDHSSGRMTESAPAYQLLLEGDKANGYADDNGEYEDPKLHGPGSADWEGRLLALKGQSFVKGSPYRKEATDRIFESFKKKYEDNALAYKTDNPETEIPIWKQKGYANEGAYLEAQRGNESESKSTENFMHINKGGYAKLDGESIQKGSLEGIRTNIENRKGFYIGDNNFRADGKSGWKRETPDGVVTIYKSISELIKSGLRTTDKGFTSLITMDYNDDGKPDTGPFKPIDLTFS